MSDEKTTGNLFVNDFKTAKKHPDYTGSLDISREQINALVQMGKEGKPVKLQLGCWEYPSKRNANEIRLFIVAEPSKGKKKSSGWDDTDKTPQKRTVSHNDFDDDDIPF